MENGGSDIISVSSAFASVVGAFAAWWAVIESKRQGTVNRKDAKIEALCVKISRAQELALEVWLNDFEQSKMSLLKLISQIGDISQEVDACFAFLPEDITCEFISYKQSCTGGNAEQADRRKLDITDNRFHQINMCAETLKKAIRTNRDSMRL